MLVLGGAKMNKKGGEQVMSVYWIVIFIIIAGSLVAGVLIFSRPVDVREVEASILADKVIGCFVDGGILKDEFKNVNRENFEEVCGISLKDDTPRYVDDDEQYFVEFYLIGDSSDGGGGGFGRVDYKGQCGTAESDKNIPVCVEKNLLVVDGEGLKVLNVFVGVGKMEQNAI
jgi:hypothetical protein